MKQVYFATTNYGKFKSINSSLTNFNIEVIQFKLDMPEPRTYDLQEIAKQKVLFAYSQIKKPCIALDSGFYIHSLNGFPRTFVNFVLETIGTDGLLKLAEGKDRKCEFRSCLAYFDEKTSEPVYFKASTEGTLSDELKGERKDYFWSDLFFVFIPKGIDRTLAQITPEEYFEWRTKREKESYTAKFAEWLCKNR